MSTIDLLISARWILPIAPENTILENHGLAIHQGKIVDCLPLEVLKEEYYAEQYLELGHHALMPGLVNAHAHTPMSLFRGLADDLDLMDWLNHHIWPAEKALINPESVAAGSRLAIAEMIRGGTTCFNDHYFFPDITANVAIECGMRASVGCLIMSVPTQWASDEKGYFDKAIDTLQHYQKNPLISWCLCPHAPYTVSDSSFERVNTLAHEYDIPIHLHLHETQAEINQSLEIYGKRPIARINELGLISDRLIAVHMTQLIEEEIALIAEKKSHVVHCPESNLKLASGFAPIQKLLEKNINVAIGTDGAASNNDLDMFGECQTAAMLAKAVSGNPKSLPASEALKMATLNGAKAIGLGDQIGSLEKGKYADVIAIDLSHFSSQPVYNPMSHLVYAIHQHQVSDVWIGGRSVLSNGQFRRIDIEKIVADAKVWKEKAWDYRAK